MKLAYSNKGRVLRSAYYLAVILWNQLDIELQSSESRMEFKKLLRLYDINKLTINRNIIG